MTDCHDAKLVIPVSYDATGVVSQYPVASVDTDTHPSNDVVKLIGKLIYISLCIRYNPFIKPCDPQAYVTMSGAASYRHCGIRDIQKLLCQRSC